MLNCCVCQVMTYEDQLQWVMSSSTHVTLKAITTTDAPSKKKKL